MVERRIIKINIKSCGGNASKTAKQYSIGLPTKWMKSMNISSEERTVELSFDGSEIKIKKDSTPPADPPKKPKQP